MNLLPKPVNDLVFTAADEMMEPGGVRTCFAKTLLSKSLVTIQEVFGVLLLVLAVLMFESLVPIRSFVIF